jgi:Tfp pilus assembly protein PilW
MRDEGGYTLIELMIGAMVSLVVFSAILAMVQVATGNQDRITERVYANQRGRPAMNRIVDRLHSACVSPALAPVREGSSDTSLVLYSKSGSAVSPTPDKYQIAFSEGALTETVYPGSGTEPSNWTFGSASSPLKLVDGVGTAKVGEPPASVPVFRYFAYEGGQVTTTPLPTPLSKENAAKTVQVDIAFTVGPRAVASPDPGAPITLTDSATLRIEPASEDSAQVNLPCL